MAQPGPLTTAARVYRKPALHDVEDVEAYVPGGYFPVDIGNKFETNPGTYTVLHKLGFGPSSTVWLVKRECKGSDEVSFHALKILRADCGGPGKAPEMEAMERLEHYGRVDKAHPHVLHIQSWFAAKSANGTHHCFVLPVLGPSLQNCRVFRALDGKRQLEICNQIANAVNYVHAFDVCHGDLSPSHILFKIPPDSSSNDFDFWRCFGHVASEEIKLATGGTPSEHSPRKVVQPADFIGLNPYTLKDITLVGFGKAFVDRDPYRPPQTLQCPFDMFPPELLFDYRPTRKLDIWQLACLMFKLLTRGFPFQPGPFQPEHPTYELLVWHITRYLGPVPSHWQGKYRWDKYQTLAPEDGAGNRDFKAWFDKRQPTESLEKILRDEPYLQGSEAKKFMDLLLDMLVWEPSKRPTSGLVYGRLVQIES